MNDDSHDTRRHTEADPSGANAGSVVNERVQELSWALVDEQISDDEVHLLDNLLLSDASARKTYIGCMQLHSDLIHYFRKPPQNPPTRTGKSLVLGFLNEGGSGVELQSPPSKDAAT